MKKVNFQEKRANRNKEVRKLVTKALKVYSEFFDVRYNYDIDEAVEELGLDHELIDQLIDDYVAQIIKSVLQFEEIVYAMQSSKDANKEFNYTELRELAHKNLGVARNLRIKDAEKILKDLMQIDNLEDIFRKIEVLRASAIILRPMCAYKTIIIIEIKSTF